MAFLLNRDAVDQQPGGNGPAGDAVTGPAPVPRWRRALVLAAAVTCALATAWLFAQSAVNGNTPASGAAGVVITGLIGATAFAGAGSFGRICLVAGLLLIPLAIVGVFLGMFVFLPATIILLAAWLADPRARPRIARVLVVPAAGVFVVMVVVWTAALVHTFR
jgi:hypothetical protein